MANRGPEPVYAALRVALLTAAVLLGTNFYPVREDHITSDRGVWEDSWNLRYGWPLRAYTVWKLEENAGAYWHRDNAITNGRMILGSALAAFAVTLTLTSVAARVSARTPSGSPSG